MNYSKFCIGIIELFYPIRHIESYVTLDHINNGYYYCSLQISLNNFYNKKLMNLLYETYVTFYETNFIENGFCYHYFHPNFESIVSNKYYFQPKIIQILKRNNKEIIIDKTFYLKLLQKKWKNYYYNLI